MNGGTLRRILVGYGSFLRAASRLLIAGLSVALAGSIVVLPLWYLATSHREAYTFLIVGVAVAAVAWFVFRKLRSAFMTRSREELVRSLLLRPSLRVGGVLVGVLLVYGLVILYSSRYFAIAVPSTVLFLFLVGYLVYGRARRKH